MKNVWLIVIPFLLFFSNKVPAQELADYELAIDSAMVLIKNNQTDMALDIITPLTKLDFPRIEIKALRVSGLAYIANKNYDEAEKILNRALDQSITLYNQLEQANCLYLLARIDAISGKFDQAIEKAQQAAYISIAIQDGDLEFRVNNILVWAFFSSNVDFNQILKYEARQYDLVSERNDDREKAFIYNNLGYDLTVAGTVPVDSTISLMKFANDTYAEIENTQGRWYTLMNLTWQHRLKNNLELSKSYGEKSYAQALIDNDRHATIESCFQIGESLIEMEQLSDAKTYYKTGLEWRGEKEDRDSYVFDVYYSKFLWETGNRKEAIGRLEKAVDFLQTSEVFYEMHGRALLASYYWENQNISLIENQLKLIEEPRNNYISLETKCLAAQVKAKMLAKSGKKSLAIALMESWLSQVKEIGAEQLVKSVENTLETIDKPPKG